MAIAVYPGTPKVFHKGKSVSEAAPTPINPSLHRHFALVRQVPGTSTSTTLCSTSTRFLHSVDLRCVRRRGDYQKHRNQGESA